MNEPTLPQDNDRDFPPIATDSVSEDLLVALQGELRRTPDDLDSDFMRRSMNVALADRAMTVQANRTRSWGPAVLGGIAASVVVIALVGVALRLSSDRGIPVSQRADSAVAGNAGADGAGADGAAAGRTPDGDYSHGDASSTGAGSNRSADGTAAGPTGGAESEQSTVGASKEETSAGHVPNTAFGGDFDDARSARTADDRELSTDDGLLPTAAVDECAMTLAGRGLSVVAWVRVAGEPALIAQRSDAEGDVRGGRLLYRASDCSEWS